MDKNFEISGLTLKFNTHYDDYGTFMEETRDPIYRTILLAFKELKEKDDAVVNVIASVGETDFESNLEFTKARLEILTDVINPYFEKLEEYETCAEVMKVFSELQ